LGAVRAVTGGGGLALIAGMLLLGQAAGTYELSELLQRGEQIKASPLYLPALLLILVTGLTADRFNRRMIMRLCLMVEFACAIGFLLFVNAQAHEVWPIFGILVALGIARAFWGPAAQSLAPNRRI
jgi:MFS family permease